MGLIFYICAGIVIGIVAEAEDRSSWLWGVGTVALGVGISVVTGYGAFFAAPLAMAGTFGLMFALNVIRG